MKDTEATLGDHVSLGGGLYDVGVDDIAQQPWINPPVAQCLGDFFWFAGSLTVQAAD